MVEKNRINWFAIIGAVFTFLCLKNWIEERSPFYYYLLPSVYTLCSIFIYKTNWYFGKAPGYTVFMIIAMLRYCVMPYFLSLTTVYFCHVINYNYVDDGIYLIIYEMIMAFIYLRYRYKKKFRRSRPDYRIYHKSTFMYVLISIVFLATTVLNYNYFFRGLTLFNQFKIENPEQYEMPVAMTLIWGTSLLWLYSYSIYSLSLKPISIKFKIIISVTLTLFLGFITFVSQSSISRWYTVICVFAGYFLLLKCYPHYKKVLRILILSPLITLVLIVSVVKNYGGENNNITLVATSSWMDAYIAGPISVNNGISMNEREDVGISTLIPDVLNNMPIVNHYIDRDKSTPYYYNKLAGRIYSPDSQGDQIIPLVSQGQTYFGTIGAPILMIFFIWLFSVYDFKYLTNYGYKTFLYAFIACWCASVLALNLTINISWWWIRILPLMVLIYAVEKFFSSKRHTSITY